MLLTTTVSVDALVGFARMDTFGGLTEDLPPCYNACMVSGRCPFCTGKLIFEIGYICYSSGQGMARIHAEDRIVCINCGRHRYLTETKNDSGGVPKGRTDALPLETLALADLSHAVGGRNGT